MGVINILYAVSCLIRTGLYFLIGTGKLSKKIYKIFPNSKKSRFSFLVLLRDFLVDVFNFLISHSQYNSPVIHKINKSY